MSEEISFEKSLSPNIKKQLDSLRKELSLILTYFHFVHIANLCSKSNDNKINIAYDDQVSHDPGKVIFNYSNYNLTDDEKSLLAIGLNFALPPAKLNYPRFLAPFENIKDLPTYKCNSNEFKTFLKNIAHSSYHN